MASDRLIRMFSLTLGLVSVAALIYVDNEIATTYIQSDGKTKALFGLIELLRFSHKYLILIPAILAIVLSVKFLWTRKFNLMDIATLVIGLTSFIGTVASSWKLLI